VACPYFYPTERMIGRLWPHPARLPLGDGHAGLCQADPGAEYRPGERAIAEWCNLGYARGQCPRCPGGDGPDAVRFTVSGEGDGRVRIYWTREKDHRPGDHGPLEFDIALRSLVSPHPNLILSRQAEAYAESYLRRTGRSHD